MVIKWIVRAFALAACVVLLATVAGSPLTGTAAGPVASSAGPTLPYAGQLTDTEGHSAPDGAYDFIFEFYSAPEGGEPVWTETQPRVSVQGGAFTTSLGALQALPANLVGQDLWLAISVRGPGEAGFTALTPRQTLAAALSGASATANAGLACPHDHLGETWTGTSVPGLKLVNPSFGHEVWAPGWISALFADSPTWAGIWGRSGANIGVLGESNSSTGVHGKSATGAGGFFESGQDHKDLYLGGHIGRLNTDPADEHSVLILSSNDDVDVRLDNDGGEDALFTVWGSAAEACNIKENGDLKCFGTKSAVVSTANHGERDLYAVESPEVWFEDFGAAALVNGEVQVSLEPIFAETVNLTEDYHVFLTATCQEPALLFVAGKTAAGFTVKGVSLDGKASSCAFDYRIVAKRMGYEKLRLEPDQRMEVSTP